MARKKITADLNGGDAVTAMGDLVFQVHDASDDSIIATANYSAIGSDNTNGTDGANIVYTLDETGGAGSNGQIILDGVEIGSVTDVKIRCKDEDGNESILSSSFEVVTNTAIQFTGLASNVEKGKAVLSVSPSAVTLEVRAYITDVTNNDEFICAVGYSPTDMASNLKGIGIKLQSTTAFRYEVGDGSAISLISLSAQTFLNAWHTWKIVALADGTWEAFLDGVSQGTQTTTGGNLAADLKGIYLTNAASADHSYQGKVDWLKVNSETWEFNEGSGTTTDSDLGTTMTLTGATWVDGE